MSPISFELIPENLRVPGVYAEIDGTQAIQGLTGQPYVALVIGQALAAPTGPLLTPTTISREEQAAALWGEGSQISHLCRAFRRVNRYTTMKAVAIADDGSGVSATGDITFSGTITAAGTICVYVGGRRVRFAAAVGDDGDDMRTAYLAAHALDTDLPLGAVAGAGSGEVDYTAKNAGETGNEIDIRYNYYEDEELPAGASIVITAMAGGSGNSDIQDVIDILGDQWFNVIAIPWTDSANLAALETELVDRWGPERAIDGLAFAAKSGTFSALETFGETRNSLHVCIMGTTGIPSLTAEVAGTVAGLAAQHLQRDAARPLQTLQLSEILAPDPLDELTKAERNQLLWAGISTYLVAAGGTTHVERLITTYQENAQGADDPTFLDVTTPATLSYLRWSLRQRFALKFPRHKLRDDGQRIPSGQAIITPNTAKAEVIALARDWEDVGLVENIDQFKEELIVERSTADPNRLNMLVPPDIVNQLRITAARIEFRL